MEWETRDEIRKKVVNLFALRTQEYLCGAITAEELTMYTRQLAENMIEEIAKADNLPQMARPVREVARPVREVARPVREVHAYPRRDNVEPLRKDTGKRVAFAAPAHQTPVMEISVGEVSKTLGLSDEEIAESAALEEAYLSGAGGARSSGPNPETHSAGPFLDKIRAEEGYEAFRKVADGVGYSGFIAEPAPECSEVPIDIHVDMTTLRVTVGGVVLQLSAGCGTLFTALGRSLYMSDGDMYANGWPKVQEIAQKLGNGAMATLQAITIVYGRDVLAVSLGRCADTRFVTKIQALEVRERRPIVLLYRGDIDSATPWMMCHETAVYRGDAL